MDSYRASNSRVRGGLWMALYVKDAYLGGFHQTIIHLKLPLTSKTKEFFQIISKSFTANTIKIQVDCGVESVKQPRNIVGEITLFHHRGTELCLGINELPDDNIGDVRRN
jgi:hypothetical protein